MSRIMRRRAASLAEMDLVPPGPSSREAPEERKARASQKSAERTETQETLAKIASIIRGLQRSG